MLFIAVSDLYFFVVASVVVLYISLMPLLAYCLIEHKSLARILIPVIRMTAIQMTVIFSYINYLQKKTYQG